MILLVKKTKLRKRKGIIRAKSVRFSHYNLGTYNLTWKYRKNKKVFYHSYFYLENKTVLPMRISTIRIPLMHLKPNPHDLPIQL